MAFSQDVSVYNWPSSARPFRIQKIHLTVLMDHGDPQGACSWDRYLIRNSFFPCHNNKVQSSGGNIVSYGKVHKRGQLKEAVLFSYISFSFFFLSLIESSSKETALFHSLPASRTPQRLNLLNCIIYTYCSQFASLKQSHLTVALLSGFVSCPRSGTLWWVKWMLMLPPSFQIPGNFLCIT